MRGSTTEIVTSSLLRGWCGYWVREYFGEPPMLLARKGTLRRISHEGTSGGWHQDGAFMGVGIRSLNVWLALTHCRLVWLPAARAAPPSLPPQRTRLGSTSTLARRCAKATDPSPPTAAALP